ncbi:hypothetical protein JHK82_020367 [Glycine max]|uniref:Uncharacterized protein n=2 Tax=Glycine subgen. Soja TaxID=1462606 RepID=A0A0R0IRE7_SOYBN|nr:hypothetical protein JHK87_020265 [Glycine soja]KAG5014685.1 hypothetical protein JHK85_020821 [Glycine max]KAG5024469.1 hypothetical protein JHK86_020383 [Glycine max]KAG5135636.1 hypothetical protein JHK82_020367 [Glycine max]KAH1049477.1 hypothetical protein GYH30_020143 [Glycine max]
MWPQQHHQRKPLHRTRKRTTNQHHKTLQAITSSQRQQVSLFFLYPEATNCSPFSDFFKKRNLFLKSAGKKNTNTDTPK